MIQFREYTHEDYPLLMTWWKAHGWEGVPAAVLPKLGMIIEADGRPIVAGFLYMDNSVGVSMLEWVVSNPDESGFSVIRGIKALVGFMTERAYDLGYGVMLTSCRQSSLVRVYEASGFSKTDIGVVHLQKFTEKQ